MTAPCWPPPEQLAISTDTLVAGVHFADPCDPVPARPALLAKLAMNDLAAMGADPIAFTLALPQPPPSMPIGCNAMPRV